MMSDAFVVRLLVNAAWQVPLCGLVAVMLDAALGHWPAHWRVAVWRGALLSAALIPVAAALWDPTPTVTAGFVLPAVQSAGGASPQASFFSIGRVYALVVSFFALRLGRRWWRLRTLSADTVGVPLTFGVRKAVVVMPARFDREATGLAREAALAHETVHVEQRDYLHLLVAELVTLPLAMHPAMAWMKARLRRAVEMRCDELAAAKFADPREYAQGLIDAARVLTEGQGVALAPGFWSSKTTFEERMTNLMQIKRMPGRLARTAAAGAMLAAGVAVVSVSARYATAAQVQQQDGKVYKAGQDGVSPPKLMYKVEPQYSEAAHDAKVSGVVTLGLQISPEGQADHYQVLTSLEPSLDQAAIDAVKQWRFEPARKNGVPVRVSATIEVHFRLK
jgi:TonB family protein